MYANKQKSKVFLAWKNFKFLKQGRKEKKGGKLD